jgi:FkbM family methyltransferase
MTAPGRGALAFDVGMFDGQDTRYYLDLGLKVVAVEANPMYIAMAQKNFAMQIEAGQLTLLHVAVSETLKEVDLTVCGNDAGASSIYADKIAHRFPLNRYRVEAQSIHSLIGKFGRPDFLKIDIEGVDIEVVSALDLASAPQWLSFEAHGDDPLKMLKHLEHLGYTRFNLINQCSFREAGNQPLIDRVALRAMRAVGYADPECVIRGGRKFKLRHSSGPAPWCYDMHTADGLRSAWARQEKSGAWFDVHAWKPAGSAVPALARAA